MDSYLIQMSDGVAMPQGLKTKGSEMVDRVFRCLKQRSRFSLDRLRPLGGVAKATSVWYKVDYDCVVYINDVTPPFANVIDEFQDILLLNFKLTEADFKVCPRSLQFSIDGVDFDLLPATNMVPPNDRSGDTVMTQHKLMLQRIKRSPDLRKAANDNSAGLTEASVEFVKRQTPFVHRVARLGKFWNTTIFYPKYLSGRSSIMETLAIKAGQEEEQANRYSSSILRAFRLFLVKVRDIRSTNLGFYMFYSKEDVPDHIQQARPLLLDPSNPYNNFLHGLKDDTTDVFAKCAAETLQRFAKVEKQGLLGMPPDVVCLFEPQPPVHDFITKLGFVLPANWLAGTRTTTSAAQPHLYIRRKDVIQPKFLECIQLVFAAMAELVKYNSLFHKKDSVVQSVEGKLTEFIDTSIRGGQHSVWRSSNDSHDAYDVTFEIPVGADGTSTVRISAKWGQL